MTHLNAEPQPPANLRNRKYRFNRHCAECGGAFGSDVREAEFCSNACRQTFNNRRNKRGGELYDLWMAMRYERDKTTKTEKRLSAFTALSRMAREFKKEDREEREGRKSWRSPKKVMERHPHLHAVATDINPRKRR